MKQLFFVMLLTPFLLSASGPSTGIDFFDGTYHAAKNKAASEGKLFFMDFTARWCTPCKWMEETTFTDPTLAAYVKGNYVALQVDIDDFDGYELKQQFGINILPSLLIFNSKGEFLEQYEESLSPSRMLAILKKHDIPSNRSAETPQYATSQPVFETVQPTQSQGYSNNSTTTHEPVLNYKIENQVTETIQPAQNYASSSNQVSESVLTAPRKEPARPLYQAEVAQVEKENFSFPSTFMMNGNAPIVNAAPGSFKREALRPNKTNTNSYSTTETIPKPTLHYNSTTDKADNYDESVVSTPAVNETIEKPTTQLIDANSFDQEGLFRFDVRRQVSNGYSIQVGAYTEYGNVIRQAAIMQQHFSEPVIVHISKNRRRTLYKLMVGEFTSHSEAVSFMRVAQAKGLQGIVKDLARQ